MRCVRAASLSAAVGAAALFAAATQTGASPFNELAGAFEACMSGYPTFEGVAARMEREGWQAFALSDLEHELARPPMRAYVSVGVGNDSSGCSVAHPLVDQAAATAMIEDYFGRAFPGKAGWENNDYGGRWIVVRGAGPNFYAWVHGAEGNSGEGAGATIQLEARPGR